MSEPAAGRCVKVAVVVFPGSNCEHDVVEAVVGLGGEATLVWHSAEGLGAVDAVIIPGGFAHGDYLRPGALARFSPVMDAVGREAAAGMPVLGICNGFQVLTEARLLEGTLDRNSGLKFLCAPAEIEVASSRSALTEGVMPGQRLQVPINHFSGAYRCDPETLRGLEENDQIILRYCSNPNGSTADIAGVASREGNVVGLMPHPERACDPYGSRDGQVLLGAFLSSAARRSGLREPWPWLNATAPSVT